VSEFSRRSLLKSLGGVVGYTALSGNASEVALLGKNPVTPAGFRVRTTRSGAGVQIENGAVCARFVPGDSGMEQQYLVYAGKGWQPLIREFHPAQYRDQTEAPLYSDQRDWQQFRLFASSGLRHVAIFRQSDDEAMVRLSGSIGPHRIEQLVTLRAGEQKFHIDVTCSFADEKPRLEYLLSTYAFLGGASPEFTHVPAMKRAPDDVIGDRIFNSPVLLIQDGDFLVALVPDLDLLNSDAVYAADARPVDGPRGFRVPVDPNRISFPAILDLELSPGAKLNPIFSFGLADYITEQHVYWRHENRNGVMVRQLSSNRVRYGFELVLQSDAPPTRGYQSVSRYIWKRYGSAWLQRPRPQTMPLAEYAKVCLPAAFAYHGDTTEDTHRYSEKEPYDPARSGALPSWLEFDLDNSQVGGIRGTPSQWYSDIQYSAWWNNARDAVGLYWWGTQGDRTLMDKARRMISLALEAPQNNGIFPSVFRYREKRWVGCYWKFGDGFDPDWRFPDKWQPSACPKFWDFNSDWYQTSAASLTCAHLLRYRRHCEENPRILPFVTRYGDFLAEHVRFDGCMPAWFSPELRTNRVMEFNAEGGVHIWALSELYQATRIRKYLDVAERMASFIVREVLPRQRWADFETFYSCASKPENVFDAHTGQYPQCTTSMMWAVHGLTALAKAGGDRTWIAAAEAVADYSLFYQASWQPNFINTAYAFGGFRSQNSDAEWLDMRSSGFAEAFAELAELTNRQDLLERAVAAMRSAFAAINHPRNVQNGVFRFPRYPVGLEPENIDHEGLPQVPLRSGFDWGEGGALAGAATLLRKFGGVYIDVPHQLAIGIDGVAVKDFSVSGRMLKLTLQNQLAELPYPFKDPYKADLSIVGLDPGEYDLVINGSSPRRVGAGDLQRLSVEIGAVNSRATAAAAISGEVRNNSSR